MNEDLIRQVVSGVVQEYLAQEEAPKAAPAAKPAEPAKAAPVQAAPAAQPQSCSGPQVPVEASGRHVHLSQEDVETLFGKGHQLTPKRSLSQPGQFLSEERVALIGPKDTIRNVAVLGPARSHTQVEVSATDARQLGLNPPVALSGHLENAAGMLIASKDAYLFSDKSLIIAQNHLHLSEGEATELGLKDGDHVDIRMQTVRPLTFENVIVRAGSAHKKAMHIDFDEANACGWQQGAMGTIVRKSACCDVGAKPTTEEQNDLELLPDDVMIDVTYLTEDHVKKALKSGCSAIVVPKKTILSPLAIDCAKKNKVEIKRM